MSTFAPGIKPFPLVRPKYLLFAILAFMLVYVVVHDESFLVHPKDPMWQHYEPFKWWLLPHGIAVHARCCWARCSSPTDFAIVLGGSIV
jgi:hypothetical protein